MNNKKNKIIKCAFFFFMIISTTNCYLSPVKKTFIVIDTFPIYQEFKKHDPVVFRIPSNRIHGLEFSIGLDKYGTIRNQNITINGKFFIQSTDLKIKKQEINFIEDYSRKVRLPDGIFLITPPFLAFNGGEVTFQMIDYEVNGYAELIDIIRKKFDVEDLTNDELKTKLNVLLIAKLPPE